MDDKILMVENEGLYSLPEISIESSKRNNIVDIAYDLAVEIGLKINDLSLVYTIEQKIPESEDIIVTYYFATMSEDVNISDKYEWVSEPYNKIDSSIYPKEFINEIKHNVRYGWSTIARVIK